MCSTDGRYVSNEAFLLYLGYRILLLQVFGDTSIADKQDSIPRFIIHNRLISKVLSLCDVGDCRT